MSLKLNYWKAISTVANMPNKNITCSSVSPTCPIGGWENTADGIALLKREKESKILVFFTSTMHSDMNC